jgi:hypothetical protein
MTFAPLAKKKKNSMPATLTADITADAIEIPVSHAEYFHDVDGVLITSGITIGFDNAIRSLAEGITITGISATSGVANLTGVTRGVDADGTIGIGYAWPSGTSIAVMGMTTGDWNKIVGNFNAAVGTWAGFNLNPVWPGATPTITSTVARFVRNGNVVHFAATINISDGKAATLTSLDLPVATSQIAGHQTALSSFKVYTDSLGDPQMSNPFAYVDQNAATPLIKFRQLGSFPDTCSAVLNVSGSYEVI